VDVVEKDVVVMKTDITENKEAVNKLKQEMADIKAYVDTQIVQMKEFVGEVVKKLPLPVAFSNEGLIIKTLTLYFECCNKTDTCIFSGGEDRFRTETRQVNKWLKVAFSAVMLGKAIFEQDPVDGLGCIKDAFDACMIDYKEDFRSFCTEPFLTSEEQDNLINQLRDDQFFATFSYDAQVGGWTCSRCKISKYGTGPLFGQTGSGPIKKEGDLGKQDGTIIKGFKSIRWILNGESMTGWTINKRTGPEMKKKPKTVIPIATVLNVVPVNREKLGKDFMFSIATTKKVYFMYASNEEEKNEWMEAIMKNVEYQVNSQKEKDLNSPKEGKTEKEQEKGKPEKEKSKGIKK